jgi:hypothetical protein
MFPQVFVSAAVVASLAGAPAEAPSLPISVSATLDQVQKPAGPPETPRHTGLKALFRGVATDLRHLPSRQNLMWVGIGGGLALAVHPLDDNLNRHLTGNDVADAVFAPGKFIGQTYVLVGSSLTVYATGRLRDQPKVSHLGMDLLRSLLLSEIITQSLKYTTSRERPDHSNDHSFPSGHAAETFAFATALERHLGWKGAVPAYLTSSYVAMSRLHDNRHWLSDVVFGSAVGIIAGRTVTRHGRTQWDYTLVPTKGGGAMILVSRHPASF